MNEPRPGVGTTRLTQAELAPGPPALTVASSTGLGHLKGADQPADIARQLDHWHVAVTANAAKPRFALGGRLGAGAQGVVYRVIDRDCRREVAMKSLRAEQCDAGDISRFVHEAQITAQLEHPGIVPVHDFGMLPDGTAFYTMKRVEGQNLAEWMAERKGRIEHRFDLLSTFVRICETVGFAHSKGVIHRDLKPRNIMVGRFGEVLVMDWGLAKVVGVADGSGVTSLRSDGDSASGDIHRTMHGFAVGTPAYMSPEQARGDANFVDQRSDLYGLGVILYEMLTGESPYIRGDVQRTLDQVAHGRVRPIDEAKLGDGGRLLAAIVRKTMAFGRDDRYASAEDMVRDLRSFLAGQAVSAYRETTVESALRLYRQHRRPILASLALATVVAAGFAGLRYREYRRDSAEVSAWSSAALAAQDQGRLEEARKYYERILARRPEDADTIRRLAAVEAGISAAIIADEQRRTRETANELRQRGDTAASSGSEADLQRAAELYLKALGLTPTDPILIARYNEVVTRNAANEEIRKARTIDAANVQRADALLAEAVRLQADGRLKEAIARVEAAQHLRPSSDSRALLRELDVAFAAQEQLAARQRRRGEADGFLDSVRAALAAGEVERAARVLEQVRGLDAGHPALAELEPLVAAAKRAERARQADGLLGQARVLLANAATLDRQVDELRHTVADREAELNEHGRPEARAVLHEQEQRLDKLAHERSSALAEAVSLLQRAHIMDSGHAAVRRALADYFIERMLDAEAHGDAAEAEANAAQARLFDDGSREKVLNGLGTVTLAANGRACRLVRLASGSERTDAPVGEPVILRPGEAIDLAHGRYLVEAEGGARFAYHLIRGETVTLDPPSPPELPPGTVYIPAGRAFGRDRRTCSDVPAFAIQEREVSCGEYLEFLNHSATRRLLVEQHKQGIWEFVPREGVSQLIVPLWRQRGSLGRSATGTFVLELADGTPVDPQQPVTAISYDDAVAYAAWLAERTQRRWRLPTRWEWMLAAQGGDGRAYPWGPRADLGLCYSFIAAQRQGAKTLLAGGSFPDDRTVQGAYDLAGSLAEFVLDTTADPSFGALMGGTYSDRQVDRFTTWSRREAMRKLAIRGFGFRLVLELP